MQFVLFWQSVKRMSPKQAHLFCQTKSFLFHSTVTVAAHSRTQSHNETQINYMDLYFGIPTTSLMIVMNDVKN